MQIRFGWMKALAFSILVLACAIRSPATSLAQTSEQVAFFESEIRPILVEHCYGCHGPDKQKGNLRLDSLATMIQGGESGPALIPGDAASSLLVQAIRYESLQMPPNGKLAPRKVEALARWIDAKAPVSPEFAKAPASRQPIEETARDREHWSFQPIRVLAPPLPENRVDSNALQPKTEAINQPTNHHPIDRWVHDRLQREGISPLPRASTRELVRRLFFDLTGLPPNYTELQAWIERIGEGPQSFREDAYRELIDHLLAQPAYAEHWARHWLDVVRFAQSNGYERDGYKPHAWRYRDYVIDAFLKDKPYDRFVLEQLAGDELPDADSTSRIATGFYRLGVFDDEPDDKRQAEFDDLDDVMVTIGSAFLGLSIGCARCHDHKFDPIPQADYYRILACIRNVQRHATPENNIENPSSFPIVENQILRERMSAFVERKKNNQPNPDPSLGLSEWGLVVRESINPPPETRILVRGNAATPGSVVEPGFLEILGESKIPFGPSESPLNELFPTSGRRLTLARWIVDPRNPLTARTLANRIWHYHFGRGIAASTSDLGIAGTPPSHPELLDFLASELVSHGWSIKHLHRLILTSETYKRSSHPSNENPQPTTGNTDAIANPFAIANTKDPGNRLLWRHNLRRLEAESVRDSMLAVSGELDARVGGKEMFPKLSGEVLAGQSKPGLGWESTPADQQRRRSIYAIVKRSVRDPLLESLDYSNTATPLAERPTTTVAPQALLLLNGRFTAERAATLSKRITAISPQLDQQITSLYQFALQRKPNDRELDIAKRSVEQMQSNYLPLAEQLHFRTDVPVSLFSGFRQQLPGDDFLICTPNLFDVQAWKCNSGTWGGGYEGIDVVEKPFGPFAILSKSEFENGEFQGQIRLSRSTELATFILRAIVDGNRWQGIALRFAPPNHSVQIESVGHGPAQVTKLDCSIPLDEWFPVRFLIEGNTVRAWIGDIQNEKPYLECALDAGQAIDRGRLGVAVWGGSLSLDRSVLTADHEEIQLARIPSFDANASDPNAWPLADWTPYGGKWSLRPEGIIHVRAEQGPKLIWEGEPFRQGTLSFEMKMHESRANIGGVILRVSEPKIGADNWLGYEVSFNMSRKTLLLGEHRNNWQPIAEVPVPVRPGVWHRLRATLQNTPDGKTTIQLYVDNQSEPSIVHTFDNPLPGDGVGLRTWGSEIEYRNLVIESDGKSTRADWSRRPNANSIRPNLEPESIASPTQVRGLGEGGNGQDAEAAERWARRKAIEMLCRTILNLNEFIYVD